MARHFGLDVGATNIKTAVVEHDGSAWRALDREQVPTHDDDGAQAVLEQLTQAGRKALSKHPGIASVGIGVPGLYYPERGATRFLVNMKGQWDGVPVGPAVRDALGLPTYLINDA